MRILVSLAVVAVACATLSISGSFPWGTVQLDAWGCGVRLRSAPPGGKIVDPVIQALAGAVTPPLCAGRHTSAKQSTLTVEVDDLVAQIDPVTGWVSFTRASTGAALLVQRGVTFGAAPSSARVGSVSALLDFDGLSLQERVYGLGEHASAGTVGMTNFSTAWEHENNGILTIPWYVSSKGYGYLHNTPGYGSVSLSTAGQSWFANATLNADCWLTASAADAPLPLADVLHRYVDVVGHAPPMPYAASGFWMSKNRYRNQTQLLDVARGFQARGLPLAVIVIDYLSWPVLGDDFLTPACWPDPGAMFAELRSAGVETVVSFYPYQNEGSANYAALVPALSAVDMTGARDAYNGCLGGQTLYDAFNADARAATFGLWTAGYGRFNVSWAWHDCDEPGRDTTRNGRWRFAAGTDTEVGPAWAREHSRTMFDGNARIGLNASTFVTLSRAAYPGSWALGAALWSGDVGTTFATLAQQVRIAQSVAMSGVALWASDTGGYLGGNTSDPVWRELVVRWTQFSAVCPLFRYHGRRLGEPPGDIATCGPTHGDNEPWQFGDAAYEAIVPTMHLRESLRGYVMSTNAATAATGLPMLRPLALAFPDDPLAADVRVEGSFMFGDALLAQPVTDFGARSADVYLPRVAAGQNWSYWFDRTLAWPGGGVNVTVRAPLNEFPLFVLSGHGL